MKDVRNIMGGEHFRRMGITEMLPCQHVNSEKDILSSSMDLAETIYHPTSTCRMGHIVNEDLKIYGLENVRICDASIMPTIVSANTNATCLMIAENLSKIIEGDESWSQLLTSKGC